MIVAFVLCKSRRARLPRGSILEEISRRNVENACKLLQAARADPIRAFLVLLDLLERDVERFAEFALTSYPK